MDILSIGNSFSTDATRYVYEAAKNQGRNIRTINMYIGGCPLELHYRNMLSDAKAYTLDINGVSWGLKASIREMLLAQHWDAVTVQQVSHLAPCYETYQPYLNALCDFIRKYQPKAKLYIHETWGYKEGSDRLLNFMKIDTHKAMYKKIRDAYAQAARDVNADGIIHSGFVMNELSEYKLHRDDFHASLGAGRYALALTWLKTFTDVDITKNTFSYFDEAVSEELINAVKAAVSRL